MTGSIAIRGQKSVKYVMAKEGDPDLWPPRFWKLQLEFSGDVQMAFCDSRRRGPPSRLRCTGYMAYTALYSTCLHSQVIRSNVLPACLSACLPSCRSLFWEMHNGADTTDTPKIP